MDGGPSVETAGPEHGSLHWPVPRETKQCSVGGEQQAGSHAGLGQGGGTWVARSREGCISGLPANPLCQGLCLPLPAPNTGLLFPCQILHLRQQVSLRDDLLQLYSDSDEEEDEDGEEEEEERDEEEEQRPEHPCEASEL